MKIYYCLLFIVFTTCKSISQGHGYSYPETIAKPILEEFDNLTLTDEYKYLQNTTDTIVKAWYSKQTNFTDSILGTYVEIDSIEKILDRNAENKLESAKRLRQDSHGGLYYLKYREQDPVSLLFFREHIDAEEEILFEPKDYKPESGLEYYIDHINPSWDGNYVAISLRYSNTFASEIVVLDTETAKLTNDLITNSRGNAFGGIQWLPDSSGFTYLYFPVLEKNEDGYLTNSVTLFHKLHSGSDKGTFAFGDNENLQISPEIFPLVSFTSKSDTYALGYVMDNTHYYKTYYASVDGLKSGKPDWKPLYDSNDVVYGNEALPNGQHLYYLSAKNAPNFRIDAVDMNEMNFSKASTIVSEMEDEVITDFEFVKDGMYYTTTKNGVEAKLYFKGPNSNKKVILPFTAGDIEIIETHGEGDQVIIECSGWSIDLTRLKIKKGNVLGHLTLAAPPIRSEFDNLVSEEILVKGHDGVEIPVSLIYDKIKGKSNRPALIESYGAYGHNIEPTFTISLSTWIALGGIRVVAHIRGGGEKGKAWHDAGKKATKSNSWKDIISVTKHLIDKGYTSSDKTVLYTASAGGISSAMAAIEKPDLFSVFMAKVPLLNPVKLKEGSHKQLSYTEFGDIDDPEEAPFLLKMDPYYNLNKTIKFPPTLLISAGKDDRLDLWETGKFIAKLQNSNNSRAPSLLKVMPEWGHGSYSNRSWAELFAFALNNIKSSGEHEPKR